MKKLLLLALMMVGISASAQWSLMPDKSPNDEYYMRGAVSGTRVQGSHLNIWMNISAQSQDLELYFYVGKNIGKGLKFDVIFDGNKTIEFSDIDLSASTSGKAQFMYSSGYYKEVKKNLLARLKQASKVFIRLKDSSNKTIGVYHFSLAGSTKIINKVIAEYARVTGDNYFYRRINNPYNN